MFLANVYGDTDANDAKTLSKAAICYRVPWKLLQRFVIGPEFNRNKGLKKPKLPIKKNKNKVVTDLERTAKG